MTCDFHPEARQDYSEAAAWYEEQRVALGDEFIAAVEAALGVIMRDPQRFQPVDGPVRIFRLKRFPYYLYFEHQPVGERVRIYAVAHHRRRPGYWQDRFRA